MKNDIFRKGRELEDPKMIGKKKFAAIGMTVMLTAFTLMSAGCSTDTASKATDDSAVSASVAWEYVAPSDLKGDTAKADSDSSEKQSDREKSTDQADSDKSTDQADSNASSEKPEGQPPEKPDGEMQAQGNGEAPSGEAPSGQPPEKPDGEAPSGAPSGMPGQGGGPNTADHD
jgi:hypothetical protein